MIYALVLILLIFCVASYLRPWFQIRSKGISISGRNYFSPLIRKSIFRNDENEKLIRTLSKIQNNQLDIDFNELLQLFYAGIDFEKGVDSLLLAKDKQIEITKEDWWTIIHSSTNLNDLINLKKNGERVTFSDINEASSLEDDSTATSSFKEDTA